MDLSKETNENVRKWYNNFTTKQIKVGVNVRHFTIMNKLISSGLKKNSSTLEVGCGIGTLTTLLNQYLNKNKLVATDISDLSVEVAKKQIPNSEFIDFFVSDMSDFKVDKKFDFIVLPDVLEHIPIDQHKQLFKVLSAHMHENSQIIIHIPHPKSLDYKRIHFPEKLQIIDQSINASTLLQDAYSNDLYLTNYISYSLYQDENDFAFIQFQLNSSKKFIAASNQTIQIKKMKERIKFNLSRFF